MSPADGGVEARPLPPVAAEVDAAAAKAGAALAFRARR